MNADTSVSPSLRTLQDHIRAAAAGHARLHIRGGGSKGFLAAAPEGDLLCTTSHCGIVDYEPSELVITARAGTPLAEVESALAEKGQCLAFEPPHHGNAGQATLGGAVATGLSGPARASVGALRDFVLGVQCLNGKGEHLTFGGQVMKNVAGYDMSRLLAGSWGTLALLTEVSLKVLPVPPSETTLRLDVAQPQALDLLHRWGGQPLPLNASCWVQDEGQGVLYLRLRGAVAAVESASRMMKAQHGAQRLDDASTAQDWTRCRDQRLPFFTAPLQDGQPLGLWRLSVPQTTPALDLPGPVLVEWHGAQRWLWAAADTATARHLHELAQQAGGHATLWRAPPGHDAAAVPRHAALAEPLARIQRQIKTAFDPHGVFAGTAGGL